ncbi:MAG: nucleotidyl transferase AbiEii/AbiGii toxin family protein [Deltaproteobacteria bacterium]|nr:nucleotidyl transferase AbiEii/AbiGii toxin family protein [Deltaproteobacteria bacterium]
MYQNEFLAEKLALRGGTALHKLYFHPARRYSEDIDLVQAEPVPIGETLDILQDTLNDFLGKPRRSQKENSVTLIYRMDSEGPPVVPLRLKVEINTREHFAVLGFIKQPFKVVSRWFKGECMITTFQLEELLATKVRALYQRRKGRDLFDLWYGIKEKGADTASIVKIFNEYMRAEGHRISVDDFRGNLETKVGHSGFVEDVVSLLAGNVNYDVKEAFNLIMEEIATRIA